MSDNSRRERKRVLNPYAATDSDGQVTRRSRRLSPPAEMVDEQSHPEVLEGPFIDESFPSTGNEKPKAISDEQLSSGVSVSKSVPRRNVSVPTRHRSTASVASTECHEPPHEQGVEKFARKQHAHFNEHAGDYVPEGTAVVLLPQNTGSVTVTYSNGDNGSNTNTTHRPSINEPWYNIGVVDGSARYFTKALRFKGFASQSEYWWPMLVITLVSALSFFIFPLLFIALFLVDLIASWSLTVRRLHDAGYSGWWALWCLIPVFGIIPIIYIGLLPTAQEKHRPQWVDNRRPNVTTLQNGHLPGYPSV